MMTCCILDIQGVFFRLSSKSMPPGGVKIVLAGTDSYFNLVLQQFIEFLSSRSPEWMTYFLFLLVPLGELVMCPFFLIPTSTKIVFALGKTKLGQYLASLDSHYGRLFSDQVWYDAFERTSFSISHSPHVSSSTSQINSALGNHDRNTSMMVVRRILEYIDQAVSTLPLSIAEAMLTFGEKRSVFFSCTCKPILCIASCPDVFVISSENESSSQKFVPFISVSTASD